MSEPIQFFRDEFPSVFANGMTELRARAATSPAAAALLEDVSGAGGVARIVLEGPGGGEVWLTVQDGVMTSSDTRPEGLPVRLAVGVPAEMAEVGLSEARKQFDLTSPDLAIQVAALASKRVEDALKGETLPFLITLRDTPDFEAVPIRVGVGLDTPPTTPKFTVDVKYADLERVSRGEFTPQQFLMGGKLKFGGDYSRALALAMNLAQQKSPKKPR